jgi:hypothetical protein
MENKLSFEKLIEISKNVAKKLTNVPEFDLRLEQAEYDKKNQVWDIVVSFLYEESEKSNIASFLGVETDNTLQLTRIYKKLKISDSEEVLGYYFYDGN